MSKYLSCFFNQLALLQVYHETCCCQPADRLKSIFQHLLLCVSKHRDVIQVNHHRERAAACSPLEDILYYKLEMGWRLCQAHWHP